RFHLLGIDVCQIIRVEHVSHHRHVVALIINDPPGHDLAGGGGDDHSGVLVADFFAGFDNRFQKIMNVEPAGGAGKVRPLGATLVVKAMTRKTLSFAKEPSAAV